MMHIVPCCYPCEGCGARVEPLALREHQRRCVAVQARPLVLAAVRAFGASEPLFTVHTFNEVVWMTFDLAKCPTPEWGASVLARLRYVTERAGFYRYG